MTADRMARGVRREVFESRIAALAPAIELFLPEGRGPFPTVVQLHGCGGRKRTQADWARAAVEAGWAAATVDSYAHRGVGSLEAYATICTGMRFWGRERAGDLFAALEWVRRQEWADARRLAAAGWSHGGWTVIDAMALRAGPEAEAATQLVGLPGAPLAGLVGAFLVYPYVGPGCLAARRGLSVRAPIAAIVGGRDVVVGGHYSRAVLQRLAAPDHPVEVIWYETATHAFDEPGARDMRVRFDADLFADARARYGRWLGSLAAG